MSGESTENSSGLGAMWQRLSAVSRWSLIGGVIVCVGLVGFLFWWTVRTDYQVLFSNLEMQDAGSIVQALKAQKVPYRLEDNGRTIQVPVQQVYDTRLMLMSANVPLSGGVGFEIFDRQSLGATEQSQRVAYQRALQGELARTIGVIEHVRSARVLLVLPESTLFKRDQQKPTAAISLVIDKGTMLKDEQISGIQRLVAASVSGMDASQVVITDQHGLALSMADTGIGASGITAVRFKLKAEAESYVTRKIVAMLEKVVGAGQAIVTVDATLNFDQITQTLQTLVPVDANDPNKGGVIRRHDSGSRPGSVDSGTESKNATTNSSEVEYEFGKRIEQVVTAPGAVTRLSIGVIVPESMNEEKREQLLQLVKAAAGADVRRGDMVVLNAVGMVGNKLATNGATEQTWVEPATEINRSGKADHRSTGAASTTLNKVWVLVGVVTLMLLLLLFLSQRNQLSARDRHALLDEIRSTLESRHQSGR